MTLTALFAIALVHLVAAISPGPSFVVSIRTAASEGLRPAVGLAMGFGLGAVVWAFAALAGLALLFQLVPALFTVLKIVGGAFLVWIAWHTWKSAREPLPEAVPGALPTSLGAAILRGLVVQLANPKPAVFFGAVFVGLVPPGLPAASLAAVLASVFIVETAWYMVVARVFSLSGPRALYARLKTRIDRAFGVLLAGLGIRIVLP